MGGLSVRSSEDMADLLLELAVKNMKRVCLQIRGVCSDDGTGDMMR